MSKLLYLLALLLLPAAAVRRWPENVRFRHEGLFVTEINGKYGFIDREGTISITPQFEEDGKFSDGLAAVEINGSGAISTRTARSGLSLNLTRCKVGRFMTEGRASP
jgi:hypothetical protein